MKLITHKVLVDAGDKQERVLLVNTITGTVDVLSKEEAALLRAWEQAQNIEVQTCDSQVAVLFEGLAAHKFLIETDAEEERLVEAELEKARSVHKCAVKKIHNVVFVMTYLCNYACPYCYENAITYDKGNALTREMVDRVFEIHHNDIRNIMLYGGEPLLPQNRPILEYIISRAPDAAYSATSNGYYLEEYFDLFQKLKVGSIMVTLDGPRELHNKTRKLKNGEGTFDKVMVGIALYLKHGIPIKIRMNISDANVNDCLALRDNLIAAFPEAFWNHVLMFELQPIFQLSRDTRFKLNNQILYDKKTEAGTPFQYNVIAKTLTPLLNRFFNQNAVANMPRYCNCDAESCERFYDAEGDVYSCILALRNKAAAVGTYYPTVSYKQESMLNRNIDTIPECRGCKLKLICGGGCANGVVGQDGSVLRPNCQEVHENLFVELPALFRKYVQDEE